MDSSVNAAIICSLQGWISCFLALPAYQMKKSLKFCLKRYFIFIC